MSNIPEPPIDPLADTNPTLGQRPSSDNTTANRSNRLLKIIIGVSLLGVVGLGIAAAVWALQPTNEAPTPVIVAQNTALPEATANITTPPENTPSEMPLVPPTALPATDEVPDEAPANPPTNQAVVPTMSAERLAAILQTPIVPQQAIDNAFYDPFTIIPERPRSEFVDYIIQQGDTIDAIARRYSLEPESIAWCNDRRIILTIRPGDVLTIPPVDGACHNILGTRNQTLADIAAEYKLDDPYTVIDSPYNPMLFGRNPADVLPGGTSLFLPGGEGELITWNPGSEVERNADGSVRSVSFAPGQAGSCGPVAPGGGAYWTNPLPAGSWVRGFYPGHTGIDLAAAPGTPIYAANSGPVLFSGFSKWGYGETVVLGHGPFSTLYGHMSSRNVSCGQFVTVGQVIGFVGSTGNSTGPHLHFEIRYNDTPQDPVQTPGIGW